MSGGEVCVIGTGMHPWGKWGRPFTEYGAAAARDALADAGAGPGEVDFVSGAATVRGGYPGFVAGAAFARALGWRGQQVASSYAACASGAQAIAAARARLLAGLSDTALVVGADSAPKGFLAPLGGDRPDDPDWLRFRLLGAANPLYFALAARRRMELYGARPEDFAAVKAKNAAHGSANPRARYRARTTPGEVLASPVVADPLHLLDVCATSDGGAALVLVRAEDARRRGAVPVRVSGLSAAVPAYPVAEPEMPYLASDPPRHGDGGPDADAPRFRAANARAAYEEAGVGPEDLDLAEVYDLSTAMELDWYEEIGLCPRGGAEKLLREGATRVGGRIPVNPSGGLASFGEAVPAQGIAQVCEITDQLRGRAGPGRRVAGARVGIAVNQGLFGHGSATVLTR